MAILPPHRQAAIMQELHSFATEAPSTLIQNPQTQRPRGRRNQHKQLAVMKARHDEIYPRLKAENGELLLVCCARELATTGELALDAKPLHDLYPFLFDVLY